MTIRWRAVRFVLPVFLLWVPAFLLLTVDARAQDLFPGGYTPAPVGFNLFTISAGFSSGALSFDPTLPVEDAHAKLGLGTVSFGRTINFAGRYSNVIFAVPYVNGHAEGVVLGQPADRWLSGAGDSVLRFSVNLFGAPAMTPQEFVKRRTRTVIGVSFTMSMPLGQYNNTRYLNIGRNRWVFKPEIGVAHTIGHWTIEGDLAGAFFTDNNDYVNGGTFEQAPITALQGHLIYTFRPAFWIAGDVNYWLGGRITTNGVPASTELSNSRLGVTLAVPFFKRQLRIAYSDGILTALGGDFKSIGVSYTWVWK